MKYFFTSDAHWGHKNVIQYCNRPFSSVEEMNETMIKNWNSVVSKSDIVYFVGDFYLGKDQNEAFSILNRLNGAEVHLILGNHDKHLKNWVREKFTSCSPYKEIYVPDPEAYGEKQFIVLCHYAMRVWNKSHHGSYQLYGHSHGSLPDDPFSRSMDVGVDANSYFPVSYEQIKEKMKLKTPRSVDHHQIRDL